MKEVIATIVLLLALGLAGCADISSTATEKSASPLSAMALTPGDAASTCGGLFGGTFGVPNTEPLGPCQWDMALVQASEAGSYQRATGKGVTVGVIDGGIHADHPDIAANFDVDRSCSFITADTPGADPSEVDPGDCSDKDAILDTFGHGTAVASIIAAPKNGVGIAGVAPEATIVALKACIAEGYCFADSVAAALRYAADVGVDVVNLSLWADPYLYYCGSDAEQRAIRHELEAAARYAQRRGVVIVAAASNEHIDLQHPGTDPLSPDYPPDAAIERAVNNSCRVLPAEIPGALTVSSVGPVGMPGYEQWLATDSAVGMGRIDVAAPGGDYGVATGTPQDGVLVAMPTDSLYFQILDSMNDASSVYTVVEEVDGRLAGYAFATGTSIATPHVAGVAALVKQMHFTWGSEAVVAAVKTSAAQLACPADWEPVDPSDERTRCYGGEGRTSFFGFGIVDAEAAAQR